MGIERSGLLFCLRISKDRTGYRKIGKVFEVFLAKPHAKT